VQSRVVFCRLGQFAVSSEQLRRTRYAVLFQLEFQYIIVPLLCCHSQNPDYLIRPGLKLSVRIKFRFTLSWKVAWRVVTALVVSTKLLYVEPG